MTLNPVPRIALGLSAGLLLALPAAAQRAFHESFDTLPLGPNVEELSPGERVWTKTPPSGWVIDDTGMPGFGQTNYLEFDGRREWAGWAFADVKWWPTVDNQRRSEFVRASGAAAIADPDEWDDAPHLKGFFNSYLSTPEIPVAGRPAGSLALFFDSSWRPEGFDDAGANWPVGPEGQAINNQTAVITAQWDGGPETEILRWDSKSDGDFFKPDAPNDAVLLDLENPAGARTLKLKFGLIEAANDWWWAFDNLTIGQPPMLTATLGRGNGFLARIVEATGRTVDPATPVTARLNGQPITVTTQAGENDFGLAEQEVRHDQSPRIFPPGSAQQVELTFRSSDGRTVVETATFTAPGYTTVRATPIVVNAVIAETDYLVLDESKGVQLMLDGAAVTPTSITREDVVAGDGTDLPDRLHVRYALPTPFVSGSEHTLKVTFTTTTAQVVEETLPFRAPVYTTLPASLATAPGTAARPGLRWYTHQLAAARPAGTSIAAAEAQLQGDYGPSIHDPAAQAAGGWFEAPQVNFEQAGAAAGNFSDASAITAQQVADAPIPGIPGLEGGNDHIAAEARTFIELPAAGVYTMVVNSDDGFQVSAGTTNHPVFRVLGQFDGGRGAADSEFYFRVEQAGVYFFRLLWFEGTGGASVEWFTVNADGTRALVNGAQPGALRAYEQRTVAEPDLAAGPPVLALVRQGGGFALEYTGVLQAAENVAGPYTAVTGAASPHPLATGAAPARYFRAAQ